MDSFVWINGALVEPGEARVSAFDAGLTHGVGLFETMRAQRGRVFRLYEHLERLRDSSRALGLTSELRINALGEAVRRVVERSELAWGTHDDDGSDRAARVRLTLTGGDLNMLNRALPGDGGAGGGGEGARGAGEPTIIIHVTPAQRYPRAMFDKGVLVTIADTKANPLNPHEGHKTLNYWWRLRELQVAASKGAGEALVLQVTNHLCGGAVSNVFLVRDGTLFTPIARGEEEAGAIGSPVLPGITRQVVGELADGMGMGLARRMLTIDEALDADEVFLTNASWGVLPVRQIEGRAVGDGMPGPVTRSLRERWLSWSADEGGTGDGG
ncbi:MAG: aminotransferase class IV [Phycisphaerales bacterium]